MPAEPVQHTQFTLSKLRAGGEGWKPWGSSRAGLKTGPVGPVVEEGVGAGARRLLRGVGREGGYREKRVRLQLQGGGREQEEGLVTVFEGRRG